MSTQYLLDRKTFTLQYPNNIAPITARVDGKVVNILTKTDLNKILVLNKYKEDELVLQKPERSGFNNFRFVTFKVRDTFLTRYQKQQADKLKTLTDTIATNIRGIKTLQATNKRLTAEIKGLMTAEPLKPEILAQLEKIPSLPDVIDVKIENNTLLVYTRDIIMVNKTTKYNLGKKIIKIGLGGGIRFAHATDPNWSRCRYVAPHITESGTACFGNVGPTVSRLHGTGEYFALASVLISYLKSYAYDNTHGPYVSLSNKSEMYQCNVVK